MVKKAAQATPNELLRRARLERGWTQRVVAERIGAPHDLMVTRWERGTAFPSAYYIERLCQLFEQRASDLGLLPESRPMASSHPVAVGQGQHRLKDLQRLDHLFQGNLEDLPAGFPPLKTLDASANNLPIQPTPFLGREREVDSVYTLLSRREVRLLTLTGPGGVGKTRLALHVAAELVDLFTDGVFFVALAPVIDAELVVPTILQTLSISQAGTQPPLALLKAVLRDKHLLLLLDNFEQVGEAAVVVAELLAACPKLTVLVTSRAMLHVQAEREFSVPPLSLPDLKHLPDLEALSQYEAVALFIQRAQTVKADFAVTNANAPAVAGICVRLDGLPLAIELAAARAKFFAPQALLPRLEQALALLTGGARDLPARQQTLRGAITWSYDLLSPAEQQLFRRLSIFVDGCTLDAAEVVCRAAGVLDGLLSLVDKSLLRQEESAEGEPRFWMLQLLREFGLETLASAGENELTRQAHMEYFLALAEEAAPHLRGSEQVRWFARLEREHENLRAALSFLLELAQRQAGIPQGRAPAEQVLRMCVALNDFWLMHGYGLEGQAFLEQALPLRTGVNASVQVQVLSYAAYMAYGVDDLERAETLGGEGLSLSRELGDRAGVAHCLSLLGSAARDKGRYLLAAARLEEAAELFGEQRNSWESSINLSEWARVAIEQGRYAQAQDLLEACVVVNQALGDKARVAWAILLQARLLFLSQVEPEQAQHLAEQCLAQFEAQGIGWMRAFALTLLGHMYLARGEWTQARAKLEESTVFQKEIGSRFDSIEPLLGLARVALGQQELGEARRRCQESLRLLVTLGVQAYMPTCLELMGMLLAAEGRGHEAVERWGMAQALREELSAPLHPVERADYEQAVGAARKALGEEAFARAWAQGRATPLEQGINDALKMMGETNKQERTSNSAEDS
jgi:predicted ATPase/transcriptional regulator with XRE-family HTH domain